MIEHVLIYTCDVCGAKTEERHMHPLPVLGSNAILRYPEIPPGGWQEIQGRLICSLHKITIEVT